MRFRVDHDGRGWQSATDTDHAISLAHRCTRWAYRPRVCILREDDPETYLLHVALLVLDAVRDVNARVIVGELLIQ